MTNETMRIGDLPAVLYGGQAERVWLYVHGRYGCKEEGEPFARIVCPEGGQVLAIDLPEHGARRGGPAGFDPWHAVPELRSVLAWARRRPSAALGGTGREIHATFRFRV